MKPIFKRLLSGVLSATMTVSAIPIISAHAEESAEPYPYTMFAASSVEGAITVNAGNLCVNGNVATNGTIVSSGNMNINGTRTEHADESMLYVLKKLNYSYFSSENVETYTEDYVLEDLNININNPIDVDGTIELTGNINLNSGIKAVDDVILNGEVKNSNNAVICSETGDINIETSNVNFNGLIYAPYGDIVIDSDNLNLNNVVIIGQTITIDCPNVNANYSNETATLIGNESDIDVELYAMGSYNADVNAIDIEWFTNYTNNSYEVLYSDDNENYTPVATVTDATTYQYLITEDFQKRYFKISLVTNYGEEIESIPFVATKSDSGYEVDFLDSDEDRLPDIYEIMIGTDVNLPDTDGDTLTDYQEIYITETDPTIYDSVVAGISDADADSDEDGLSNSVEITMGTNPQKADTDDDGLSDYDEINIHNTDPAMPDSDNDNVEDGSEIKIGLDPNNPETFGIPDGEYKVSQSISTDSLILSSVNSEESPYELSIDLKTNLDAEKKLSIVQSSYSVSIQNDAMIGASFDISISDECNPEDIVIRYNIKEGYRANTLNLYSEFEELSGLKRLNIFKFDEETRMLLPIDTQFDVENGTLFAEVDELGTYCIMDMEIWLNNLGVTLSIPEVNDTYYTSSPKYSPKKAPSTTTPSWTPTYVNAPIDLVFILQSAGTSSSDFNTEKSVISNFSQKVFNEYEDVRVYIIEFNKDEADFCKPNYLQSSNIQYLTQYSDVVSALGTITYTSESYYCDRGQAFQKLFTNVNLRENADKFIYKFVNGRTKSYTNYDQTSVLNSNLGAYSEIFPSNWYYEDASFGNNIRNRITGRGDLFITLNDDTYSEMIKHLEGKISPERAVYDILLPTNWKKVQLEGEISPDNDIDTDKDSLTDWEEVDVDKLIWHDDGSFDIPTFNMATVVSQLQRFNTVFINDLLASSERYYLPIISDPTLKDSDNDGVCDKDDGSPLHCFDQRFMIVDSYEYIPSSDFVERHYQNGLECYSSLKGDTKKLLLYDYRYRCFATGGMTSLMNIVKNDAVKYHNYLYSTKYYYLLLSLYLNGEGETFTFPSDEMYNIIWSHNANIEHYVYNINKIKEAAEELITNNDSNNPITLSTKPDSIFKLACYKGHNCDTHNPTNDDSTGYYYDTALALDIGYSLGESLCGMTGEAYLEDNIYHLKVKYYLIDTYEFAVHWDDDVTDLERELHYLHECGWSKEFLMNGVYEEEFTWKKGETLYPRILCRHRG